MNSQFLLLQVNPRVVCKNDKLCYEAVVTNFITTPEPPPPYVACLQNCVRTVLEYYGKSNKEIDIFIAELNVNCSYVTKDCSQLRDCYFIQILYKFTSQIADDFLYCAVNLDNCCGGLQSFTCLQRCAIDALTNNSIDISTISSFLFRLYKECPDASDCKAQQKCYLEQFALQFSELSNYGSIIDYFNDCVIQNRCCDVGTLTGKLSNSSQPKSKCVPCQPKPPCVPCQAKPLASIDWGDCETTVAEICPIQGTTSSIIKGCHKYKHEGQYNLTVTYLGIKSSAIIKVIKCCKEDQKCCKK